MKVQVKMFAVARQLTQSEQVELELPPEATVAVLRAALVQQFPALASVIEYVMIAVDAQYANDQTIVSEEAEIACIPPVSGG